MNGYANVSLSNELNEVGKRGLYGFWLVHLKFVKKIISHYYVSGTVIPPDYFVSSGC